MRHRSPADRTRVARTLAALGMIAVLAITMGASAGGGSHNAAGRAVLQAARKHLGETYVWGGTGPDSWDCSGFTSRLWRDVGGVKDIPRVADDQQVWTVPIPAEQALAGDLVFFGNPASHVGIYAGDGQMVDASSSQHGVVTRDIWDEKVVRYGRVPRAGMPPVRPWTPAPAPPATAQPVTAPPASSPPATSIPAPTGTLSLLPALRRAPLRGLPARDQRGVSAVPLRAARNGASVRGSRHWTDLQLIRVAWQHAGGGVLPTTRAAVEAAGSATPLARVRVGDLVLYGQPVSHLGIYLGHGFMADASPSLGRVVVRRVFVSPTVRFVRLPVTR